MNRFKNYCFCFVLLSSLLYLSCKKEDKPAEVALTKQAETERLLSTAKTWLRENSSLPKSNNQNDFDISSLQADWGKYSITKNSAGTKVINVPLSFIQAKNREKQAFYTELSVLLDKDGVSQGMVKEYMENPYAGKTRLNIYTGSGRLFISGIYDPKTRMINMNGQNELSGIGKSRSNSKGGAKLMYYDPDEDGYDLEEVGITAPYPPPPPPVYPGEPYYPGPIPGLPVGPGPEPDGGGTGTPEPTDIIAELKDYPCAKALVQQLSTIKSAIGTLIKNTFAKNDQVNIIYEARDDLKGTQTDGKLVSVAGSNYRVGLNPDILNNATKEYILVTLYHEALHAYFEQKEAVLGKVEFQKQFGNLEPGSGRLLLAQNFDHAPMAYTTYVNGLRDAILAFNPNFSTARAQALAEAGILTLDAAKLKINKEERDTTNPDNAYQGTKCP